eukprot:1323861-Pleurochrysis_carterae.AAC.5
MPVVLHRTLCLAGSPLGLGSEAIWGCDEQYVAKAAKRIRPYSPSSARVDQRVGAYFDDAAPTRVGEVRRLYPQSPMGWYDCAFLIFPRASVLG